MFSLFVKTKQKIYRRIRSYRAQRAEYRMKTDAREAWEAVNLYHGNLGAGALRKNWIKYEFLYRFIRMRKPIDVLELGTGISTVAIAHALMENEREMGTAISGAYRVTTLEELEQYHSKAQEIFPENLKKYVDFILSPKTERAYQLFRGVRYEKVPERPYDVVFVDGPTTGAPSDGHKTFDFDFLDVVSRSESPVYGIVDLRLSSMWVYEQVFGREKVRLDRERSLGFVGPVTRRDMHKTEDIIALHTFRSSR